MVKVEESKDKTKDKNGTKTTPNVREGVWSSEEGERKKRQEVKQREEKAKRKRGKKKSREKR